MSAYFSLLDRRTRFDVDASACDLDDLAPCGGVEVKVGGDLDWGEFVRRAVASSWPGVERLADLGGTVGDVVRGNPERYGQAVADVVASVATWDRAEERPRTFAFAECQFGPSASRFQERSADDEYRYDIVDVTFLFEQGDRTAPIRDPELAARLGIEPGRRLPLAEFAERLRAAAAGWPRLDGHRR